MHRLQHPGCLKTPKQGLHSGVCTTRSAMQPALLHLLQFTVRADCSQFCFCCTQCAFNVRHADLGPLRISSTRRRRRRRRRCRQVPGCFDVASLAEQLCCGLLVPSRTCSAPNTLSQFLTDRAGKFVILRRHEHGRPVSRSESDLQGPNLGGRIPRQNFRCKSLFALGSTWNCHYFKEDARYRD
ncbi:hypothetical protein BU25DRAFT_35680 [Macroventuria anomochaeta]|uniref:Uncharacterized protein n=1 Tax=Macroventuria anomochaeta TaxID=301207 RepID=A0ACB6S326_9PLEO|nr:uncharacterized protein BU25DRAFT_35680 [Macroventuria anomochaeta]KAF2628429.1 hypothetical protein BU25DRAFT_35680 [Macroventuria anomochaeta]